MNFEIVELDEFSGNETAIYSVLVDDSGLSLFDYFLEENKEEFKSEIKFILNRLQVINETTSARENFFKLEEGKPGDGVAALYDEPDSKLRLYCIRYGRVAIILGSGGHKPKEITAWQEDKKLTDEVETMMEISKEISQRMKEGELKLTPDGILIGNLIFSENENE